MIEQKVEFFDCIANCDDEDMPTDFIKIHCVDNEGYLRKDIHFVVETELKVHVLNLLPIRQGFD